MCRLVAYAGAEMSLDKLIFGGSHSLLIQSYRPRELLTGHVNADGYGVVWFDEDGPVSVHGERPIWQGVQLERLLGTVRTGLAVAALRNVTPGMSYDRSGIPPIVRSGLAFVLNGYLEDFRSVCLKPMLEALSSDTLASFEGVSDTELLALAVTERVTAGADLGAALVDVAVATLELARSVGRTAQLNMVASDGHQLVAVRTSTIGRSNSLYLGTGVELAERGQFLASEPIVQSGEWSAIEEDTVVTLDSEGASFSRLPR